MQPTHQPEAQARETPNLACASGWCRPFILCLWLLCLLAVGGCSGKSVPQPIWCGHIANLSGANQAAGQSAARGIRLAVEEINKDLSQGAGRPFKVIHADAHGNLETFESEAIRLVALNRVAFLLGGTTFDQVERLERARVPVLTPLGSSKRPLDEAVFFMGIPTTTRAKALALYAANDLNATSATVVQDDRLEEAGIFADHFALEFAAALKLKSAKAEPAIRRIHLAKTDRGNPLVSISKDPPSVDGPNIWVLAAKFEDMPESPTAPAAILLGLESDRLPAIDSLPSKASRVYTVTAFQADTTPAKEFARRFKEAFQVEADEHAALAYEAMKLLHEAIDKSKDNLKLDNIREELGRIKNFPGLAGPLSFSEARQLNRPVFVAPLGQGGLPAAKRFDFGD